MIWLLLALPAVGLVLLLLDQNRRLSVTTYQVDCQRLPKAFEGLRVAQISDLHSTWFGKNQDKLFAALEQAAPDLIVITGDLIDKRRTRPGEYGPALCLVARARELAPVYYATGNHEWQSGLLRSLAPQLGQAGARVLLDAAEPFQRGADALRVAGANDPAALVGLVEPQDYKRAFFGRVDALCRAQDGGFTLLLSHRPELFKLYVMAGADLVFSGHAHGGQIRLPFLGGLYMPDQGWLPKYDSGVFSMGATTMVVSRGLGNSKFPLRVLNPPELVVAVLHRQE